MTKVDLALLHELNNEAKRLIREYNAVMKRIRAMTDFRFCDRCGEAEPEEGFYPQKSFGPESISGLLCLPCEAALRAEAAEAVKDD